MKKITLLLLFFFSLASYAQLTEGFESGFPAGWIKMNAPAGPSFGIGTTQQWILNTTPNPTNPSGYAAHTGIEAALIQTEQIGINNTEEDWMITSLQLIPANGQLRFWTRQTIDGDQGTIYQIRASLNPIQDNQTAFATLQTWTESDLQDLNGDITQYVEQIVDFPAAYVGQQVYIAFVRIHFQQGTPRGGDRWLVDDVRVRAECVSPIGLGTTAVQSSTVSLSWGNPGLATNFEISIVPDGQDLGPGFAVTAPGTNPTSYTTTLADIVLQAGTCYEYYVRSVCGTAEDPIYSGWGGPFPFCTLPLGSICSDPLVVGDLPFQATGNTANFGDEVDTPQGNGCGAVPTGTNFLQGSEVFYSYTPDVGGTISITMTPGGTPSGNSSLFVYEGCSNVGLNCIAGVANVNSTPRIVTIPVTAGMTYIIVISSSTPSVGYNLVIQREDCTPKPTFLDAAGIELTTAHLTWISPEFSSWQVDVQPLNSPIPTGDGDATVTDTFYDPVLTAATQYQFWVRAECSPGSGVYTAWAGPFPFNTKVCADDDRCAYTFRMSGNNAAAWGGTKMLVRQFGIVVGEIGPTFVAGGGPQDVTILLCDDAPFEIFWQTAGTNNPNNRVLNVINNFGQTIFTKPAGTGGVGSVIFTDFNDCDTPQCDIAPTNVQIPVATVNTTNFTVTWTAPATTLWDIYYVEVPGAAPTAATTPQFENVAVADVNNPSFTFPVGTLQPDHTYDVYVRVVCNLPSDSPWSTVVTVTTDPTCFRPITPLVVAAPIVVPNSTTASATFTWLPGEANTEWEILIIPGPNPPAVAPDNDTPATYTGIFVPTFTATDLLPATIYYAYVRARCTPTDESIWVPFPIFNTDTCNDADQCVYKFVLSTATGNSWNGGRMQVRQNGIVVATIGAASINNANGISVPLCPGVDFDLFWSVPGTNPANIGVSIQNPFLDVLFTKLPGTGTPLTVVYQSVTNCTPAACSKPINMTAVAQATSAFLDWDDISSPPSEEFAIYIIETGVGAAPINDPATPPTLPSPAFPTPITESSFTVSAATGFALEPSTSYTYYVKSLCSDTESSTWTVLSPFTFVTKPLNDECLNATPVTINPGQDCIPANLAHGYTYGGTASAQPTNVGTGCGTTEDDIWFSFVAGPSGSQTINFTNLVATPASAKINHSVFSGTCDALTQLYCSTALSSNATGLTPGQTYYVRAYTLGSNPAQRVEFDLCITSPPANDNCANAQEVGVNPIWECSVALNQPGNTLGATPSTTPTTPGTGCGTTDDDVWFRFTATNNIHIINLNSIVGTPASVTLNHSVYSGTCDAPVLKYCSNQLESVATGLTPNEVYYIRVYSSGNTAGQSATFNVCVSTPPPPATNDECGAAIPITVNTNSKCAPANLAHGNIIGATASSQPSTCTGTENDDVWFTFTATSTTHFINLLNVEGTTDDLNHAVYTGTCDGGLTLKYCSTAGSLESTSTTFIVDQLYYVRVWSNSSASQVTIFDICVKSISTCEGAEPFCGSSVDNPYIYDNTTGVTSTGQIACLFTTPNPTYYTLHIGETGPIEFNILQNTEFDADGNPIGTNLDVDYVAWGPFSSEESCDEIVFGPCTPVPCPNNTTNPNFYPVGNVADCSYDGSFTETLHLPDAQEGEYYVILVTNFNGSAGQIRLIQTNFYDEGAGETICCNVGLGPDQSVCATSVTLNALLDIEDLNNVPSTFQWYFNDSVTPIEGANESTYIATQSGTYRVTGDCGLNPVEDTIVVVLGPVIETTTPADYVLCDGDDNNGTAPFDLQTLNSQVLGTLNPLDYIVSYHLTEVAANTTGTAGIDISAPIEFPTQTLYIRVESTTLATCFDVVPVNLVVTPLPNASFDYDADEYCKNVGTDPLITITGVAGEFTATPEGLSLNPLTGEIDLLASDAGTYVVVNTILEAGGCPEVQFPVTITITEPSDAAFNYGPLPAFCQNDADPTPLLEGNAGVFSADAGVIIDPVTGVVDLSESATGTFTIYNTIGAAGGCGEVVSETEITITPLPNAEFSYPSNFYCTDEANPSPSVAIGEFTADPAGMVIDSVTGVINLGASNAGVYTVTHKILAAGGCDDVIDTFSITINAPGMADFSYTDGPYCKDGGTALPTFLVGATAGNFTYEPLGLSINTTTGVIDLANSEAGTYQVTNTIPNVGNCLGDEKSTSITITALLTGELAYSSGAFCRTSFSESAADTLPDGGFFSAEPSGLSIDPNTGTINPNSSSAGTYTVMYSVPGNGGCGPFEDSTSVTIIPDFSVMFEFGCENNEYILRVLPVNESFDPLTSNYTWTGTGTFEPSTTSNAIVLKSEGTFTVRVTTADGCYAELPYTPDSIGCMIQKGISPNNDDENDSFDLSAYDVDHLSIFNRYGTEVYQYDNYVDEWYGQSNSGEELPDGTYFYVIDKANGKNETGWIYINR